MMLALMMSTDSLLVTQPDRCILTLSKIHGAVAQLGERDNRTVEATGSIPVCSTIHVAKVLITHKELHGRRERDQGPATVLWRGQLGGKPQVALLESSARGGTTVRSPSAPFLLHMR